ncbi:LacI family DNA-binding transcriptional regulator [Actinomyces ruminis]|uniref:LacI family transcriptional regulator n=1 Tax=Actinomyces ruminis TaxID=1937003 RepID=A0ABX4MAZ1_9ACTO|nr:LacI family DNA-binding transcriptional regulator [Actinomyces ruminis]PHP52639.1 LacI family transcriptional regulator [Actinomyces ruminis]
MADRVTMGDVARRAGVSAKTVSNVLRGAPGASAATRRRVLEAVAALGYRLNPSASALRSGRRGSITLALPTLQQPLYAALAQELMRAAGDTAVILELTSGEAEREQEILSGSWARRSDAAVLVPRGLDPASRSATERTRIKAPLVLIADSGPRAVPRVTCPPEAQVELVAAHLLALGRRRIAVVGSSSAADQWTEACARGLREAGLRVDAEAVVRVDAPDGLLGGVEAVARLAHAGADVDAIVCHNDALAAGAVSALRRRGARVPQDVAVIGRGDTEAAVFATPTLTSVSLDLPKLARAALDLLTPDADLGTPPQQGAWARAGAAATPARAPLIQTAPTLSIRGSTVDGAEAAPERWGNSTASGAELSPE